jgi:nucleotide-binding universal stress UspA family protein
MKTVESGKSVKLNSILFASDFSCCSEAALPFALSIARRYGATLHAAHVLPSVAEMVLIWPENWRAMMEEEEKRIHHKVAQLQEQLLGVPHSILTPRGKVADAIEQIIATHDIDLAVVGTQGRTGFYKLLLGSIAEEILRRASCPVLSIGPRVTAKAGQGEFHSILFATDFSKESLTALPYAISLAEEDEACLRILHVVEQPAAGIVDLEEVTD